MKAITQEELDEIIHLHELWVNGNYKNGEKMHLDDCNLSNLDLSNRNLREAEFWCCNLENTDFSSSNITNVDFDNCYSLETIITDENTLPKIRCPENGEFIGYKKCLLRDKFFEGCIVKLLIPSDAKRSSGTGIECRCSKAKVLGFYYYGGKELELGDDAVISLHDHSFEYKLGEFVYPDYFDDCRWRNQTHGIYFYMKEDFGYGI